MVGSQRDRAPTLGSDVKLTEVVFDNGYFLIFEKKSCYRSKQVFFGIMKRSRHTPWTVKPRFYELKMGKYRVPSGIRLVSTRLQQYFQ